MKCPPNNIHKVRVPGLQTDKQTNKHNHQTSLSTCGRCTRCLPHPRPPPHTHTHTHTHTPHTGHPPHGQSIHQLTMADVTTITSVAWQTNYSRLPWFNRRTTNCLPLPPDSPLSSGRRQRGSVLPSLGQSCWRASPWAPPVTRSWLVSPRTPGSSLSWLDRIGSWSPADITNHWGDVHGYRWPAAGGRAAGFRTYPGGEGVCAAGLALHRPLLRITPAWQPDPMGAHQYIFSPVTCTSVGRPDEKAVAALTTNKIQSLRNKSEIA